MYTENGASATAMYTTVVSPTDRCDELKCNEEGTRRTGYGTPACAHCACTGTNTHAGRVLESSVVS